MQARTRPIVAFVTNVWKRPELTRRVLNVYQRYQGELKDRLDLRLVAVGSEGRKSQELCMRYGFDYCEFDNEPLTAKRNAGLAAARKHDPDAVVMAGSDDILSPNYFQTVYALVQEQPAVGLRDFYYVHAHKRQLAYWPGYKGRRQFEPIGAGRSYHRSLLEAMQWQLWPADSDANRSMDGIAYRNLRKHGFGFKAYAMRELGVWAMDIKSGPNMNPWTPERYETIWRGEEALRTMHRFGMEPVLEWRLAFWPYIAAACRLRTWRIVRDSGRLRRRWGSRLRSMLGRTLDPDRYVIADDS